MTGKEPLREFFAWLSGFNQFGFLFISIIAELFRLSTGFFEQTPVETQAENERYKIVKNPE
jgi:hypothetical protein